MKQIVFATNNKNKLREMREIMAGLYEVLSLEDIGCHEEIIEDADTIQGNAKIKADFVTSRYHIDCFADDTGLEVDALGGAPGVYSARYAGSDKDPAANRRRLLKELEGLPFEKRTARFRCVISLIQDGKLHLFEGTCEGHIALHESVGVQGFGYDSIFVPEGLDVTIAEISIEEKNRLSHRGKAMRLLQCHLSQNPGSTSSI